MFDKNLVPSILQQIDEVLEKSRADLSKFIAQTISRILLPVWKSWIGFGGRKVAL